MKTTTFKDAGRVFLLAVIGLFVAVLVYPFFHELGHAAMSFLVGAEVKQFTLFPLPSVLCDVGMLTNFDKILIGVSGMALPFSVAAVFPKRWVVTEYIRFLLKGISLLAFMIPFVSVAVGCNPQDDMVQTIGYWRWGRGEILIFAIIFASLILVSIIKDRPIQAVKKYFEIK